MTKDNHICIKQYEQAADEKVSLDGIKWLRKWDVCIQCDSAEEAEALRARLSQPEQEPVAWMWNVHSGAGYTSRGIDFYPTSIPFAKHTPLYTAPPQREWVGLTDEEYEAMAEQYVTNCYFDTLKYAKAIEAKLKEKNT